MTRTHLHVYYNVHKVLLDAAEFCRSIGDAVSADFLTPHANVHGTELICRQCGHKWRAYKKEMDSGAVRGAR